jgi:hypothetical protein
MRFELMNFLKKESNYTQKSKYYYQCSKINKHLLNEITGKQFYFAFKIDYIVTSYTIFFYFLWATSSLNVIFYNHRKLIKYSLPWRHHQTRLNFTRLRDSFCTRFYKSFGTPVVRYHFLECQMSIINEWLSSFLKHERIYEMFLTYMVHLLVGFYIIWIYTSTRHSLQNEVKQLKIFYFPPSDSDQIRWFITFESVFPFVLSDSVQLFSWIRV